MILYILLYKYSKDMDSTDSDSTSKYFSVDIFIKPRVHIGRVVMRERTDMFF